MDMFILYALSAKKDETTDLWCICARNDRVRRERSDMMKKMVNKRKNKKMDASARDALCDVMYDEQKHKSFISA